MLMWVSSSYPLGVLFNKLPSSVLLQGSSVFLQESSVLFQALIKHRQKLVLALLTGPAAVDRVLHDSFPLLLGQIERVLNCAVVLEDVSAKVCWVVAVDAELDTLLKELPDGDLANLLDRLQANIAQWANSQQDLLLDDTCQQL